MALLDILKQRKQQMVGPTQASDVLAQQRMRATGKDFRPTTGPQISNVQSQLAAQAGQTQQNQLALGGMIAQQQFGQQEKAQTEQFKLEQKSAKQKVGEQKQNIAAMGQIDDMRRQAQEEEARARLVERESSATKEMTNKYANALHDLTNEREIAEQDIFMQAARERDSLGVDKFQALLEQSAHMLAMSDTAFVDTIKSIGQIRRLEDEVEFKKESMRTAFGYDLEILNQYFDITSLTNADEREYRRAIADMDMDTAISLAQQAVKESAYTNILEGTTEAVSAYYKGKN